MNRQQIEAIAALKGHRYELLLAVACGLDTAAAAELIYISESTAKTWLKDIRHALDARNTTHAVAMAVAAGLITEEDLT